MEMKKTKTHKCVLDIISLCIATASLIIALIALNSITKVEGFENLLKKTSENTLQLNTMIIELKQQNSLQQKSIDNNNLELNELKKQTKTLLDLQESNANQLDLQKKGDRSNLIGDYLILSDLYLKLHEFNSIPDERIFIDVSYREKTIQYLQDLKSMLYQGINISLLKMNDDIYSQWWVFYQQTDFTINSLKEEYLLNTYYDIPIKINTKRYYNNSIISKKESDIKTLERFKEYSRTFWIKGLTPMINIKEMNYYYDKYQKLSNFGRTIKE